VEFLHKLPNVSSFFGFRTGHEGKVFEQWVTGFRSADQLIDKMQPVYTEASP
jgi:hypothetical protein